MTMSACFGHRKRMNRRSGVLHRNNTMAAMTCCTLGDTLLSRRRQFPMNACLKATQLICRKGRLKLSHLGCITMARSTPRRNGIVLGNSNEPFFFAHPLFHLIRCRIAPVTPCTSNTFLVMDIAFEQRGSFVGQKCVTGKALVLRPGFSPNDERICDYAPQQVTPSTHNNHPNIVKRMMYMTITIPA